MTNLKYRVLGICEKLTSHDFYDVDDLIETVKEFDLFINLIEYGKERLFSTFTSKEKPYENEDLQDYMERCIHEYAIPKWLNEEKIKEYFYEEFEEQYEKMKEEETRWNTKF